MLFLVFISVLMKLLHYSHPKPLKMVIKMEEIMFIQARCEIFVKYFQTRQVMSGLRCRMKIKAAERRTVHECD